MNVPPKCVLACFVVLLGCADETLLRSSPPDAKVYYRDRLIGITPTEISVPHDEIDDGLKLRVERDGYKTQEVIVPTEIAPGRIVGGIFSLGISTIFKRPTTLPDEFDVDLHPVRPAIAASAPAVPAPESVAAPAANGDSQKRLRQVQDLFDRGLINEAEYRRYRADILKGL